jgi:hypothetical protein
MELLFFVAAILVVDLFAVTVGADSRRGYHDEQPRAI